MSRTEQFQGTRDGAQVRGPVTHRYRNISFCTPSPYSSLTSRQWERSHKPDHSNSLSTSPNNQPAPASFAKNPKNRIWIVTGREVQERASSQPPVTTRRDWNFNRTASSRVSQSPSTASLHIICRSTAFLPKDHQENSCTGHKSSSGKDRENLT